MNRFLAPVVDVRSVSGFQDIMCMVLFLVNYTHLLLKKKWIPNCWWLEMYYDCHNDQLPNGIIVKWNSAQMLTPRYANGDWQAIIITTILISNSHPKIIRKSFWRWGGIRVKCSEYKVQWELRPWSLNVPHEVDTPLLPLYIIWAARLRASSQREWPNKRL